jgi:DNA-binding NarL/FixJ family response regulator
MPELGSVQTSLSRVTCDIAPPYGDCAPHPNRRLRVLLADDYPSLLTALRRLLGMSYAVVASVRTGAQALEAAARLQPDVVVIDVRLPDIDGLQACGLVKVVAPDARIVVFTASEDPDIRQRALAAGASAFVLKHRAGDELIAAIEGALDHECADADWSPP